MSRPLAITATAAALAGLLLAPTRPAEACTSFIVTKGASKDGSTMITYAADSHSLYGELYYRPAATHPPGAKKKIFDWDSGRYLGEIDEVPKTYRVVGNMNEHQLVISETTYGGRKSLRNPKGGIDYGSLMWTALQRARTAREAIRVMIALVDKYGYYSWGETFSIADPNEVWIMDLIGKGPGIKGALWVARRVPDGYVAAHANQPRIHRFPLNDPKSCLYAKDVISFARAKGWFKGEDKKFSFADVYAPADCRDLRVREGRVWAFFHRVARKAKVPIDYAACKPGAKPMPIWVKPDRKIGPRDLMDLMRDHFEDTPFDLRKGIGAGPWGLPYRWRPLTWKHKGNKYLNDRATATQQTAFGFVSQSRAWLPGAIGGLLWFSVDDAAATVYVPMYAGLTKIPKAYAVGTGSFNKFTWESAFWVFNWVSNWAYTRWSHMFPDIRKLQVKLEHKFVTDQPELEKKALAAFKQDPARAEALINEYSAKASAMVVDRWRLLGQELLMKYLDGNRRDAKGKVEHPGYPKEWYGRIVEERGDHYLVRKRVQTLPARTAKKAANQNAPDPVVSGNPVPCQPRPAMAGCRDCATTPGTGGLSLLPLLVALGLLLRRRTRKRGATSASG